MDKEYYTSGQFASKAHVTLRTIRFYDQKDILKPSFHTESGNRLYTDKDFAKLQQILLLKYLGFSLEEIKEMTLSSFDTYSLKESLKLQKRLVKEKIEEMEEMTKAIDSTYEMLDKDQQINWNDMMNLIHLTAMERSLAEQYKNSANISARIRLHTDFSTNKEGWFPWIVKNSGIKSGMKILEVGCGSGAIWKETIDSLPKKLKIVLSDISDGMVREVKKEFDDDPRFSFDICDCQKTKYKDETFDIVYANHVFFYCEDIKKTLKEIRRILKPGGRLICSTYGRNHMKEITELVQKFNKEIVLSAEKLYDVFGLENGSKMLKPYFKNIRKEIYEDSIEINESEPILSYILSCHGNQNRYILSKYKEFKDYVEEKTECGFHITKEAGIFICEK